MQQQTTTRTTLAQSPRRRQSIDGQLSLGKQPSNCFDGPLRSERRIRMVFHLAQRGDVGDGRSTSKAHQTYVFKLGEMGAVLNKTH